jgi:hypothetical protein
MVSPWITRIRKYGFPLTLSLILFFAAAIRCYEITLPFSKSWEIGFQELIARNHLIYGFDQTHFVSVISVLDGQNIYHLSHPPLLQILISFSYFIFGIHEWSARLVPILFSLGTVILVFAIASRIWDRRTALFAAFFAAFMPMSAYYGRIVNFEPVVLFFILLFAWAYLAGDGTGDKKYFVLAVIALILGGLTDWPFFLILPFFVLISLITRKRIRETIVVFFLGCGVAGGYLLVKSAIVGYHSGVSGWFDHILVRSNIPSYIGNPNLYLITLSRMWNDFSLAIVCAAAGAILWGYHTRKSAIEGKDLQVKDLTAPAILLFGVSYLVIFPESTFVHEWQLYYLIPGVSLFAGFALSSLFFSSSPDPVRTRLFRGGGLLLIILFLALSAQSMASYHKEDFSESAYMGMLIENSTEPGDVISIIGLVNPIAYYANRTLIQNPIEGPDYAQIEKYHPKFVVIPSNSSTDVHWNITNLENVLIREKYHRLTARPLYSLWIKNVSLPDILVMRNPDSVEARNTQNGTIIPDADTRGYVVPLRVIDFKAALFEHPLANKNIRANYRVNTTNDSVLSFGITLNRETWDPSKGNGVAFDLYCQSGGNETHLFSRYIDPKNNPGDRIYQYFTVPLDTCQGNSTTISFATSCGPKDDCKYDWAYWIDPRIETTRR